MFRSFTHLAVSLSPSPARSLVLNTLPTCIAGGIMLSQTLPVLGQTTEPTDGVNLNATPTVVNGRISRPTLQPGSQGEAVIELQSVLMLLGYYSGPLSGVYQDNTQTAVQKFQADAGINPDGIVGPATWSSLFPVSPAEANPPGGSNAASAPASTPVSSTPDSTEQNPPQPTGASSEGTPTPAAEPASTTTTDASQPSRPVLRLGDRGDVVRQLQERLKNLGFYNGSIDGIFGTQTENAVKQAQADNALTVDGIVGPATWNAID